MRRKQPLLKRIFLRRPCVENESLVLPDGRRAKLKQDEWSVYGFSAHGYELKIEVSSRNGEDTESIIIYERSSIHGG